jgi:uncharacterized membrane protein (DUF373 family)
MKNEHANDPLTRALAQVIAYCVKLLAVLIVFVVLWSLIDVFVHVGRQFYESWNTAFSTETLFSTLGSFLVVLIAIEIYLNIIFYLNEDKINANLVLATALTAIARKVIILDYTQVSYEHIAATALLIFAVGIVFWLLTRKV